MVQRSPKGTKREEPFSFLKSELELVNKNIRLVQNDKKQYISNKTKNKETLC